MPCNTDDYPTYHQFLHCDESQRPNVNKKCHIYSSKVTNGFNHFLPFYFGYLSVVLALLVYHQKMQK